MHVANPFVVCDASCPTHVRNFGRKRCCVQTTTLFESRNIPRGLVDIIGPCFVI
jgi:hypothetical protein